MAAGDIKAGGAIVTIGVDLSPLTQGLKVAAKHLNTFGTKLAGLGAGVSAFGASIVTPLAAMAKVFADTGSQLDDISQRTGVSAASLSELGYAAKLSGSSLETVETAFKAMGKSFAKIAQGKIPNVFASLGLNAEKLQGIAPEEQFITIAEAISNVWDPTLQAGYAMQIFGKAGTELLPMLRGGKQGMEELRLEAKRLGIAMTDADAGAAAELGDSLDRIGEAFRGGLLKAGAALAPIITKIANGFANVIGFVSNWVGNNRELVVGIAAVGVGISAIGFGLVAAGGAAIFMGLAIMGTLATLGAISAIASVLASPFVLAAIAAVGLLVGLAYVTGFLGLAWKAAMKLGDQLGEAWTAFSTAITSGNVEAAFAVVTTGIQAAWATAVNYISSIGVTAFYGILNVWTQVTAAMQIAFGKVSDAVEISIVSIQTGFELAYLASQKLLGKDVNKQIAITAGLAAGKIGQIKGRGDQRNASISAGANAITGANNAARDAVIQGLAAGPKAAQAAYSEAIKTAMETGGSSSKRTNQFAGMMEGLSSSVGQKGESVGTFSAAAVGRIGASSIDKEQLDVARSMKGLLSSIDKTLNRIEEDD